MLEAGVTEQADERTKPVRPARNDRDKERHRTSGIRARLANQALDHLPLAVVALDRLLRLQYWNLHAAVLFRLPEAVPDDAPALLAVLEASGRLKPRQCERVIEFCAGIIALDNQAEADCWLRLSLGRQQRVVFKLQTLGGGRWLLVIEDLNPVVQASRPVGDAMLDPLTGLSNRRHFSDTLNDVVRHAGPETRHAVMMIDLDHFMTANEALGHSIGDALLCLVAQRLRRQTREEDVVARLGGDDFAILLPDGQTAEAMAKRVVDVLSRPFLVEGHVANVSASIGIARLPEHGRLADDLLRHADLALYDAKSCGGRTWRLFNPAMAEQSRTRRDLETDVRKALALGEFSLAYQPQLNVKTNRLTGFEALARWNHPTRGEVPPSVFIPIAEAIGCIQELGEWVLRTACRQAARWPEPLGVAVNVSPLQLADCGRLLAVIEAALQVTGLAANRLEIEITEGALMAQEATVIDFLTRLRALGISVAMDDFGTGYSSIGQLRAFPFDKIKIDRSFITDLAHDGKATAVIRAIIGLGSALGMTTIAEGVETAEQATMVEADGCANIQGYLISRPVLETEIDDLLRKYSSGPTLP